MIRVRVIDLPSFKGSLLGNLLSSKYRRRYLHLLRQHFPVLERRARRVLRNPRSTVRHLHKIRDDEEALTQEIVQMASRYWRYGNTRITSLLRTAGWPVNPKRLEPIWRQEGLKVPKKQPKRAARG